MGALGKVIDAILFLFFVVMAVVPPLLDAQTILPKEIYPEFLIDLNNKYISDFGDYLVVEKPHFFVGLIWHELVVLWPLAIANVYAFLAGKSWFGTICLFFGASVLTSMSAILGEMLSSGKASEIMLMVYVPFMGIAILAVLRGLVCCSSKSTGSVGKTTKIMPRRKLA